MTDQAPQNPSVSANNAPAASQPAIPSQSAPTQEAPKAPAPEQNASKQTLEQPAESSKPNESANPDTSKQPSEFKIPDAYKDKLWASKIKNEEDLYKQIDNLNSLVGKKMVVPDFATATEAEVEEYYKASRPKDKTAYVFDEAVAPEMKEGFSEMLYKNGINAHQANNLIKDYNAFESAAKAALYDKDTFLTSIEKAKGKDAKAYLVKAREAAKSTLPPEIFEKVDGMPNEYFATALEVSDIMYNKYDAAMKKLQKEHGVEETGLQGLESPKLGDPVDRKIEIKKVREDINKLTQRNHTAAEKQVLTDKLYKLINMKQ